MTNFTPLDAIERASVDEIRQVQLQRMQWSLNHCYQHISHYKKDFDDQGIHPQDLKQLEDLRHFPFTVKEDLRQNYPTGLFATPMKDVVRFHASSGTTGKPTVVGYTKKDIETWSHCVARSIRAAGGDEHSIVHVSYGYGLFTGGLGAHYGAEKLGATVIPVSGGMTGRQIQLIADLKPDIIMVTPSYFLKIISDAKQHQVDPQQWSLKAAILGAEPWTEAMREVIETESCTQATNIYGLSEIIGPGVAQECLETQDGLTVWEDHFYPEIIDPETLEVLPEGQEGELVLTTLTKEATPLVRYRTRDLTKILPGTARTMRRIDRILGRSDDMLIIRGVNVFPTQIEEQILKIPELQNNYQLEVEQKDNTNALHVHVELKNADDDAKFISQHLESLIKDFIGIFAQVKIQPQGTLPESQGKAVRVKKSKF